MEETNEALDSLAGWLVVAASLVLLVLVWGAIYTFTVYAEPLGRTFGLSALRVSSVFSIATATFLVAGGLIGVLVARMPYRPVVVAGGLGIGLGTAMLQVVTSYAGLVVAFGLMGAAGGTLFVVVISLVPQWFEEYEGRAMGVAMTGNGIGVLVLPFAWVWLLERTDVRGAWAVVGAGIVGATLLAARVFRRPPWVRPEEAGPVDVARLRSRLSTTSYRVALLGYPLLWAWYFVLSAGLVDLLTTAGIARTVAATAFGTIGGVSVVARLASGWLADRVGARETFAGGVVLAALGLFALAGVDSRLQMYVTLAVFGAGLGVIATLFSPVVLRQFGPEDATAVVGSFNIAEAAGAFLGPLGVHWAVRVTGGYTLPMVALACLTLLGAGLFYWSTDPRRAPSA